MSDIIINGGRPLSGVIEPQGSKNAALPIIFATAATRGVSVISGVPDIGDVRVAVKLIEDLGAVVIREGSTLTVNTEHMKYKRPKRELTSAIRASSYLIGASLSRFGIFHLSEFGGCNFCNRPTDMHVFAAKALGASESSGVLTADRLRGARITFDKVSVGATMNALIMAASASGTTVIEGAAREPHVRALIEYLTSAGAKIFETNSSLTVEGAELHGGRTHVIADMIEAGTYLLAAPMTDGCVTVKGAAALGLESFLAPLSESGVGVTLTASDVTLSGSPKGPIKIRTAPYPGYPTDLQPQIAPLMAKFHGGVIEERVWKNRFSYLSVLSRFGLQAELNGAYAEIRPSSLRAACVTAPDLRGGAAAVLCALSADGKSIIKNTEVMLRGYSEITKKLGALGAEIYQIKD